MSEWSDRIANHEAQTELRRLEAAIERTTKRVKGTTQVEAHHRLASATQYLRRAIDSSDPELIPPSQLNRITPELQAAAEQLEVFASDRDGTHLEAANANADTWLDEADALPVVVTPEQIGDLQETLVTFRRSAGQHLRHVEEDVQAVAAALDSLRDDLTAQKDDIEAQKGRLDTAIATYQEQFTAAEATRTATFNEALDEARQVATAEIDSAKVQLTEAVSDAKDAVSRLGEEVTDQATAKISELDALQEQAVRIVGLIGNTGLTGHYQKIANEEKRTANIWRYVAVGAFLLAVGTHLLLPGFDFETAADTWKDLLPKLAISIPLLGLAGYAIAESRHHRGEEQANRQMELQLASIDPYLAPLPEDRRYEIKERMADRFFPGSRVEKAAQIEADQESAES